MCHPPKVNYATEWEYRKHFERIYCQRPIRTFDGIPVHFRKSKFEHCMYESSRRDDIKDDFSRTRAERIDWIQATLANPSADLYQGWDKKNRRCDPNSRVAVVYEQFAVIIRLRRNADGSIRSADFVTAYQADNSIEKIRSMPRWG